ncbi:MAG: hypothetical protein U1E76_02715 [Planctomycetota bacterium]
MNHARAGGLRALLPLLVWPVLTACALSYSSIGDPVPPHDQLKIGTSTKADALRQLGPPLLVRRQFDGELFVYRQDKSRFRALTLVPLVPVFYYSDLDAHRIDVTLLFDKSAILRGIGVQREEPG